jgi:predicted RecB family nuclease
MEAGAPLIIGAVLPDDPAAGRRGRPDLLVRASRPWEPDARGHRYWPAIVVDHRALDTRRSQVRQLQADPEVAVVDLRAASVDDLLPVGQLPADPPQRRDGLALAHYHRLLEACGHAASTPLAAVIGSDHAMAWTDLADHNLLDAYDEAFARRREVVDTAEAGGATPAPLKVGECERCAWRAHCRVRLEHEDSVSLVPGVGGRQIPLLQSVGVRTRSDLAALRTPQATDPRFAVLAEDLGGDWLDEAVDQAWVATAGGGRPHRRRAAPALALEDHALEVDLDMENALDGSVYLWGMLIDDRYEPVVDWGQPGSALEARVFVAFWDRLDAMVRRSAAERRPLVLYVWHEEAELGAMRRGAVVAAEELGRRDLTDRLEDRLANDLEVVDLLAVYKRQFLHGNGYSLKVVAPKVGFSWVDPDPSGSDSMVWHQLAVTPPEPGRADIRPAMRQRLLRYNEDDVRATAAIRNWLRTATPDELPR